MKNTGLEEMAHAFLEKIKIADHNPEAKRARQALGYSKTKPTFYKSKQRAKTKASRLANKLRRKINAN